MIEFHLDTRSGVPTYLQLVQQVKQALRLGILQPGRPAADGEGGRRQPRDQPEHRAQGLPRARPRRPRRGPPRPGDVRLERAARRCRPTTSRRSARRCSAGSSARGPPGSTTRTWPRSSPTRVRPPAVVEGRMSAAAASSRRARQALRLELGAARLHARDPAGHGHRARRPERRRQDDAAAARRRPDRAERRRVRVFGLSPRRRRERACFRASASSRRITRSTRASRSPRR